MLNRQDKQNIYGLLTQAFEKNVEVPLAKVALYLKDQGLNYEEFGYKKMKLLLCDLSEFLELRTSMRKGHESEAVVLHDFREVSGAKESHPAVSNPAPSGALNDEQRKAIQTLLLSHYVPEKEYPMAALSKLLLDNGVNYHTYGFSKMKNLLTALPFISLRNMNENNVQQTLVTVHAAKAPQPKPETKPVSRNPIRPAARPARKPVNKTPKAETRKPEPVKAQPAPVKNEANTVFFVPPKLILSVQESFGLGLETNSIISLIKTDYEAALRDHKTVQRDDAYLFPLSLKSKEGEPLVASLKKASAGSPYDYYVNFVGTDKEKPKDVLRSQIHFADFDAAIQSLAGLAKKEDWCYRHSKDPYIILKIYLQYTVYRLLSENKIMNDETSGSAAFNTGLVTPDFDDIYAVLLKSNDPSIEEKYIFQGFTIAGSQGVGKIIVEHFNPLPPKAAYLTSPADAVFDPTCDIHTDYQHIILDNLDRFPMEFLKKLTLPFAEESKILAQIQRERTDYGKEHLFERLEEAIKENSLLFNLIHVSLDAAIALSLKMIRYDSRVALPSFFPTRNVMSMMIPLVFDKNAGPEAVLLIEKTPSGNYQGQTMLTLKQCYVNARLFGPLDNTFLKANLIED
jgi:hypothetical protein